MDKDALTKEILQMMDRLASGDCMFMPDADHYTDVLDIYLGGAWDGKVDWDELVEEAWQISMKIDTFLYGSPFGGTYVKRKKKTPIKD